MYISVTGLRLNHVWHVPTFWRYTIPAMIDAQNASGNRSAEARKVGGMHHTLSTWDSRAHMLSYLRSTNHAAAMRRFRTIATGRVAGWEAEDKPTWSEALARFHAEGRDVYV